MRLERSTRSKSTLSFIHFINNKRRVRVLFSSINLYLFLLVYLGGGSIISTKNAQSGAFYLACRPQYIPILSMCLATLGSALPFLVDGAGVAGKNLYTGVYTFSFFLNTERITFISAWLLSCRLKLFTLSSLFNAAVWVEREWAELDSVFIVGLVDNRRLLQDYTRNLYLSPDLYKAYITRGYNHTYQEVIL